MVAIVVPSMRIIGRVRQMRRICEATMLSLSTASRRKTAVFPRIVAKHRSNPFDFAQELVGLEIH